MTHANDLYGIEVKTKAKFIRKLITLTILFSIVLSVVYMIYWVGVMSDDMILDYTGNLFSPLANLLFPNDNSLYIYRNTSVVLFSLVFPLMFMYYLIDKTESKLLKDYRDYLSIQEEKRLQLEKKKYLSQFDIIKSFSICLSLNYKNRVIEQKVKNHLNSAIFTKLKETLSNLKDDVKISINDVMIVFSDNFDEYDKIYFVLLKTLSKIQKVLNEKYNLELSPSLTTDAYQANDLIDLQKIKKEHYEIQTFKMENRALTSALFRKKYQHLNHNKFAGIPIGEYVMLDKNSNNSYELNVVYKNLSKTLASL